VTGPVTPTSGPGGVPDKSSIRSSLLAPVLAVTIVAAVGFVLLEFLKHIVVIITYCLGGALVVVPLVLASRLLRGYHGHERWRRMATITSAVAAGVVLIIIAHLLSRHGWLIVVIPAALVAISRLVDHGARRRKKQPGPASAPR
jgi:hypothetical protein